jgi:HSP20 family protein
MENKKNVSLIRAGLSALMKSPEAPETVVSPVADIFETADAFIVKLDMPGATKESISLNVDPSRLIVHGGILPHHKEQFKLLFSEIGRKKYLREFNLGTGMKLDEIDAQFEDGVLTVTLPKNDEVKAREIHIR